MTFTERFQDSFLGPAGGWFVANLILILAIMLPVMVGVAMAVYADRKIWAAMQMRRGPNVVGPFGLLQTFADAAKLFLKETIVPSGASTGVFLLAPMISFVLALAIWAVMPFDAGLVLADLNVGLLYVFAVSSMGVYGIIMSGWASNSKYPFLGGLRSAAQMVSYEVSMGFILVAVMLYAQSLNLSDIVMAQKGNVLGILNGNVFNPLLFPMGVMFFITALAETNRPPFDLPEAEAELVAGYQVEYSSHELRALLPRRIRQHPVHVRADPGAVPRRLAAAAGLGAAVPHPRLRLDAAEDGLHLLLLRLGEGGRAAVSL